MFLVVLLLLSSLNSSYETFNGELIPNVCNYICPTSAQVIEFNCSVSDSNPAIIWEIVVNGRAPFNINFIASSMLNDNKYTGELNGIEVTLNSASTNFLSSIATFTMPPLDILSNAVKLTCNNQSSTLQSAGESLSKIVQLCLVVYMLIIDMILMSF